MGGTRRTKDQDAFYNEHLPSFVRSFEARKLKDEFWPQVTKEWFDRWPLSAPPDKLVEEEGSVKKATTVLKSRKVEVSISIDQRRA